MLVHLPVIGNVNFVAMTSDPLITQFLLHNRYRVTNELLPKILNRR